MIDLNTLRIEFAKYLTEHTTTRWGMDAALLHCCRVSYEAGLKDGAAAHGAGVPQEARWPTPG